MANKAPKLHPAARALKISTCSTWNATNAATTLAAAIIGGRAVSKHIRESFQSFADATFDNEARIGELSAELAKLPKPVANAIAKRVANLHRREVEGKPATDVASYFAMHADNRVCKLDVATVLADAAAKFAESDAGKLAAALARIAELEKTVAPADVAQAA